MEEPPKPAALAEFPVVITLPIQWGDQDAFGHVNNAVYFRWFESARITYLQWTGLEAISARGVGPILAAIGCNYRRQLTYPDTIHVGARITRIGRSSMTMEHALWSQALSEIAADGSSTLVAFDYDQQKSVPVNAAVRLAIERLEGKKFE